MQVEVRFNSEGFATGLYQQWLFDDYYSVFITEDMDEDGDGKPDHHRLEALRETILGNLKSHDFFTNSERQGEKLTYDSVSQGAIAMRGHRVEIRFFLPFTMPINPHNSPLTYRIFDPSFYIEMLHAEKQNAIVLKDAPEGCGYRLEPPTPDPEKVAYAASLPASQSGGSELGQFFAESVIIECRTKP
jgi:ABC-type uncharacterized transport system substrate-binding protein